VIPARHRSSWRPVARTAAIDATRPPPLPVLDEDGVGIPAFQVVLEQDEPDVPLLSMEMLKALFSIDFCEASCGVGKTARRTRGVTAIQTGQGSFSVRGEENQDFLHNPLTLGRLEKPLCMR